MQFLRIPKNFQNILKQFFVLPSISVCIPKHFHVWCVCWVLVTCPKHVLGIPNHVLRIRKELLYIHKHFLDMPKQFLSIPKHVLGVPKHF